MSTFKAPRRRRPSERTRKKIHYKTARIAAKLGVDKGYIREIFLAVLAAKGKKSALYSASKENVDSAIRCASQVFRKRDFRAAIKTRTALQRVVEFCALNRASYVATKPPILIQRRVRVGKVGCGKGAAVLFMTELL